MTRANGKQVQGPRVFIEGKKFEQLLELIQYREELYSRRAQDDDWMIRIRLVNADIATQVKRVFRGHI